MHHIFVNPKNVDIENKLIIISKTFDIENYNHLANSLRIKLKENILCSVLQFISSFDYKCSVESIDKDSIALKIEEEIKSKELGININLYQGFTKSDKFEYIIEKAVELGVHKIIPVNNEYSIVKYSESDKKLETKINRFNKIAKSAAEQSKRHIIPKVSNPIDFVQLSKLKNGVNSYNILFYENANGICETKKIIFEIKNKIINLSDEKCEINVIIGPEGGFSESEINIAKDSLFYILSLGDRILRTETASLTALSILMYEFDDV